MTTTEKVIAGCYLVLFLMLTAYRNEDYASHVAIWTNAAVQSPEKARPAYNLAVAYRDAGKFDKARQQYIHVLDLGDDEYEKAALTDIAAARHCGGERHGWRDPDLGDAQAVRDGSF